MLLFIMVKDDDYKWLYTTVSYPISILNVTKAFKTTSSLHSHIANGQFIYILLTIEF